MRFIGIQAKNRREWNVIHLANMHINATTIALYDTLSPEATQFVLNQTELITMTCSFEYVKKLSAMKIEDSKKPSDQQTLFRLANIVSFEDVTDKESLDLAEQAGIKVYSYAQILKEGSTHTLDVHEPSRDDIFMLSYTSGTTGDPKGVKLSHHMVVCAIAAAQLRNGDIPFDESDSYISYLPAAHSFEQCLFGAAIVTGMRCGFFGGNVLEMVSHDMPALKPTFFPSVPRLYNKIYGRIQDKFKATTGCLGWLIKRAVATKLAGLKEGRLTHPCYDALVFNKVKAMMGGNLKSMVTGSAPLGADVLDFLRIAFCCDLREGYGMTETCGASCATFNSDPNAGHVGGPLAQVKIRLRDIPEMNYLHSNNPPKGEVCFWGPSNMSGYFKNAEKTKETKSTDGWIFSGDVARINPDMSISIIDRAKNIFKLSQGEYIAPEKLENVFVQSSFVGQAFVFGDSLNDYTVAFFTIEPASAKRWGTQNGGLSVDQCLSSPAFKQAVFDDVMALAVVNKFNSLEKPKNIALILDPWTIEDGMLTPTQKLKRNIAKDRLRPDIDRMYKEPIMKVGKAIKAAESKKT